MQQWVVSLDPARVQLDLVSGWLRGAYWSPNVRREVIATAFANSLVAGAYPVDGAQIGVARVVTDQATFAYLADVFVAEPARGDGVGRAMVAALMADPRLQTVRRWSLATRDAHEVYRALGFGPIEPAIWMEYKPDPSTWQDPAG